MDDPGATGNYIRKKRVWGAETNAEAEQTNSRFLTTDFTDFTDFMDFMDFMDKKTVCHDSTVFDPEAQTRRELVEVR
jgi:hypothetical protein